MDINKKALTFEDVLLVPKYSEILPEDTDIKTKLSRNITLNIPIISAAMDRVTEHKMAIAMARQGAVGVIHKNLSIDEQSSEITKVKRSESFIIYKPFKVDKETKLSDAKSMMLDQNISSFLVTDTSNKLIGIVTNRDISYEKDLDQKSVESIMSRDLVVSKNINITKDEAVFIMHKNRIEKLPLIDDNHHLIGLITIKDINRKINYADSLYNDKGELIVGAGVGIFDYDRAKSLIGAGADFLVVDSAHGNSKNVITTVSKLKSKYSSIDVIAGNVVTPDGVRNLINAGADAVKVGIGPGSICTTRVVTGVGIPQLSAIVDCYDEAVKIDSTVPIIADGGVRNSGDIAKALAGGASSVMLGSLLAGTDETPSDIMFYKGKRYKSYRGMGSIGAMISGNNDRYNQAKVEKSKLVPEGVEGKVTYKGGVMDVLHQLVGGLRSSMGYCGSIDIKTLKDSAQFIKITSSGYKESHVHDLLITEEAPNYKE